MPDQIPASGNAAPPQEYSFSVSPDQIAQARGAGYSDQQIVEHLFSKAPDQFTAAAKAGYSPTEILDHLASRGQPSGVIDSLEQGVADVAGGVGKTIQTHLGAGPVSNKLLDVAKSVAPTNFVPANIIDQSGVHPSNVAAWLARRAPGTAAVVGLPIAAVAAAPETIGAAGATALAAGTGFLLNAGNEAQTAATNRTGDQNATPNTSDLVRGDLTAAGESALGALPVSRFLPGAATTAATGVKGLAKAAGYLAKTAGAEGASGAAQSLTQQVGQTVGTPRGVKIDPAQVADSAAGSAIGGAAAGAFPAARASLNAVKYRRVTPEFQEPATQLANRMQNYADGQTVKDGGAEVFTKARNDVKSELGAAVTDLRSRIDLSQDANNILNNALAGQRLTKGDFNALQRAVAGDPQADNVINLLRQNHVADMVASTGSISNGKFSGGLAPAIGHKLSGENLLKTALIASGVEGSHLIGFSPETLAAVGAGYAGLKALDKFTGANKPGVRFMRNFADDGQTPVRLNVPQPVASPASTSPPVGPTGPRIPLAPTPWGNSATQAPTQPVIDPLALPKSVTAPAAAIARGAALVQKLQQRAQATVPASEPAVNPLALPKSITGPAANIMRGAALTQKLQQQSDAAQPSQAPQSAPQVGPITKANGATTEGPYRLPVAPYSSLPVNEAAQRILGDVRAAKVPVKNATAFLTKTMALLNTVRDKVQTVTQAAPSIPPADVARFEGVRSQKAAIEYREHLKREYPQAAPVLDKVFSDDAIARQWAQKK